MSQPASESLGVDRSELYHLIDQLPEHELWTARRFLGYLLGQQDPVMQALEEAPWDDEPWTETEEQAFQKSWAEMKEGHLIPMEQVFEHLGPP